MGKKRFRSCHCTRKAGTGAPMGKPNSVGIVTKKEPLIRLGRPRVFSATDAPVSLLRRCCFRWQAPMSVPPVNQAPGLHDGIRSAKAENVPTRLPLASRICFPFRLHHGDCLTTASLYYHCTITVRSWVSEAIGRVVCLLTRFCRHMWS